MQIVNYLKNSNLKLSIDLNPFVWSFVAHHQGPSKTDPNLHIWYMRFLPLSVTLVFDDGTWIPYADVFPEIEEMEEVITDVEGSI